MVRGKESGRRVAEDEAGKVSREIQVMRGLVVTLRGLDLTLVMVGVVVDRDLMSFKKINICVFQRTLCRQQLEARIAAKNLGHSSRLEATVAQTKVPVVGVERSEFRWEIGLAY